MQFREPSTPTLSRKKKIKHNSTSKVNTKSTLPSMQKTESYTPTSILHQMETLLRSSRLSSGLWVTGELINVYPKNRSGHMYFDVKDDNANKLSCTLFGVDHILSGDVQSRLSNGMQVAVYGNIKCICKYKGSQYQLNVRKLEVIHEEDGMYEKQLTHWKYELEAEGIFDDSHKQKLPTYAQHIAVLTSESGAALQDIKQTLADAKVPVFLHVYPCIVQGEQCVPTILKQLQTVCDECVHVDHSDDKRCTHPPIDMVLIARGGGSREDLWEFNQPLLLRSIDALRGIGKLPPIGCAIGHQIDHPLLDRACDASYITPTCAAQSIAQAFQALHTTMQAKYQHLQHQLIHHLNIQDQHYESLHHTILSHHPTKTNMRMTLRVGYDALQNQILQRMHEQQNKYHALHRNISTHPLFSNFSKRMIIEKQSIQQNIRKYIESQNTSWQTQCTIIHEYQPWAFLYSHPNMVILKDAQHKDLSIHTMANDSKPRIVKMLTSKGCYDVKIKVL